MKYGELKLDTADVGVLVVKRKNTRKAHAAIRDLIVQSPSLSYAEIAKMLGCSHWLVYSVAVEFGVRRPRGAGSPARRNVKNEVKEKRSTTKPVPDLELRRLTKLNQAEIDIGAEELVREGLLEIERTYKLRKE